ncbi:carbohydrate ABC transporter permease [Salinispora tropica]|uniref:Binding-protein-dependent transport systems inner membrane component n=1 Tax=Salinispora tropica (strain ATCC BAA-916 / DSM 44818 / JCM 13857 / NBRC 105044 / CNB-440) TaxID=369723 RepID=A4X9V6_SALTO|nr:carbohydrate ABC transporter permease [Salinispora tropica]ABP55696.1 binding-protein-dependent transport systems inner membrane component [Salinispora tropica CNB-440]
MTTTTTRRTSPPAVAAPPRKRRGPAAGVVGRTLRYGLLLLFLLIILMPAYVLVVTSFKSGSDIGVNGQWNLPEQWSTESWAKAWAALGPSFVRTFQLAIPVALISSLLGAANGFVLSRWRFPGADIVFTLILFGMFIPYQAVMIPLRDVVSTLGIAPGIPTLIFVHCVYGIPICTLIFRNYYATTVPVEMVEAAWVDGAGLLRTFRSIILPVSIPGFVVAVIWQFTSAWNDYLFAIFLSNTRNGPITIALNALAGAQSPDYAASMAGALITSLPTLVVYVFLGRWFIGGLMAGSVKS